MVHGELTANISEDHAQTDGLASLPLTPLVNNLPSDWNSLEREADFFEKFEAVDE